MRTIRHKQIEEHRADTADMSYSLATGGKTYEISGAAYRQRQLDRLEFLMLKKEYAGLNSSEVKEMNALRFYLGH
jgi:hypothetical protein